MTTDARYVESKWRPNTGASETANVIEVSDGFSYPAVVDVLQVTLTPQ